MKRSRRAGVAVVSVAALMFSSACGGDSKNNSGSSGSTEVEVFTWWTDGGEKAGLDALVTEFTSQCPSYTFVNGAVAGGAGGTAKQVLTTRLDQGDPPDSFQAHAGAEQLGYISADQLQDLSEQYREWNLTSVFPTGLIENLTVDGKIYAVPANIHRANMLWSNTKVLSTAGITTEPTSVDELIAQLTTLRSKGVEAPLAVGKAWTQLMLLEAVLISDLGSSAFSGLWTGGTDWKSSAVTAAMNHYKTLLEFSSPDRDGLDWNDAEQNLINGTAAYQLMGDWEAGDLEAKGFQDYGYSPFPGNGNTFQWLADSFVLPKNAQNPAGGRCWLKAIGSAAGQKAFNTKKGSIPARTDAVAIDYPPYQQSAITAWKSGIQVPSCAHGASCSTALQTALGEVLTTFSSDRNVATLQQSVAAAVAQHTRKG